MTPSHGIPVGRISALIGLGEFALLGVLTLIAYGIYKIYLKEVSAKRHANLRRRFWVLCLFYTASAALSGLYWWLAFQTSDLMPVQTIAAYLALLALGVSAVTVIRLAQAYVYICLFLANMSVGVPRLIANVFTLVFSVLVAGWIGASVFDLHLGPILATSAIFSVVLGLALQDTLGNFFSGLALQMDHSFNIGDWIEVQNGGQKWVGQVMEITWRATILVGFSDELIAIPNRTLAQSQMTSYTQAGKPPRRNLTFRFPLETDLDRAREVLLSALRETPGVMKDPEPSVLIIETTESWIVMRSYYSLIDFGAQFNINDELITRTLRRLRDAGLRLANPALIVETRRLAAAPVEASSSGGAGSSAPA